jgi:hypothetical protein
MAACNSTPESADYWLLYANTTKDESGYKNRHGEVMIPAGKYAFCLTDTFRSYAIVAGGHSGWIGIDRQEHILFDVFPYDNGPDYPADGLFRILRDKKIGFADAATGRIVIEPAFDCAYPFEHGLAKVSEVCTSRRDGEHTFWESNAWYYIDKTGRKVDKPVE